MIDAADEARVLAFKFNDRGNSLQDLERPEEAIVCYDRALQINPGFAAALVNRGNALRALRRFDEALSSIDAGLLIKPAFPEALNNRGNVLRDLGRLEEAVASFDAALAIRPGFVLAHGNRGHALLDLKRPRAALAAFSTVLQIVPDDGEALFGHASALLQLRYGLEEAIAEFDRAAAGGIDRVETLVGKAAALAELQRQGEAAACLAELLLIAPDREYIHGSLTRARMQICDWGNLPALIDELSALVRQGRRATHPQSLLSLTDSPDLQQACARVFVHDKYPQDLALGPCRSVVEESRGARIRVAYLSADFSDHPVSQLLVGVLERHDRERFEVIGVSLRAGRGGAFEDRVRRAFDRFLDVAELGDREVAAQLRELRVDIAVDLMGFTQDLRLGIFAHRAAPVQVTYLGYAGTLSAPYMDYLLADDVVIPVGEERWYGEQVVRLPHSYLPNDDQREIGAKPTRAQAGLPESGLVLCAFTSAYKINPPIFAIWMQLLREAQGSILWLRQMTAEAHDNMHREAQRRGIAPERLVFAPHMANMTEHLGRLGLADLYLDTLPYNAHSTACDALWAGIPVLTCAGRGFAARVAASALTAVGLPQLITHSLEEYQRRGRELTQDPQQLQLLKAHLAANRTSSPLFDTPRFCRHLESAYVTMHERAVRGEKPVGFAVEPSV